MGARTIVAVAGTALCLICAESAAPAFSQEAPAATRPAPMPRAAPVRRPMTPAQLLTLPIAEGVPNAEVLRRGQYLVRAGDCAACHTPEGGQALAGGFGLNTPFGVIYSTNLTSDETGVGRMSPETFYEALHHGIGPNGSPIYPAMPYNYFTRVSRADSDAMLAYLKTTPPVSARPPANKLSFPFNIRFLVRGWNLFFFKPGEFKNDPGKSTEWNRGAYLVTGLGHCGGCHTPKNKLAGDRGGRALYGGELDTWVAPDLTANARTGLGAWSVEDVVEYLQTGRNARANAGGPMAEVVTDSTSLIDVADLRAIAVYLKDQPASPAASVRAPDAAAMSRGAAIYSDACASCHMLEGKGQPRFFAKLSGNAMLQQSDSVGLMHLILAGSRTAPTAMRPSPLSMPSFAWKLNDQQLADVATYVRNSWGNQAAPVTAREVAGMRKKLGLTKVKRTDMSGDRP